MRAGCGLGNIAPGQGDYFQIVKGGGHGDYRTLVLAPASVQEMCDLTMLAFELADRYRNPAVVLADGAIGQMVEPVVFPEPVPELVSPPWAVCGTAATRANLLSSILLDPLELEAHNQALETKYARAFAAEQRHEAYALDGATEIFVAYGIVARILQSTVDLARAAGIRAGLLRPVSLWPFPQAALEALVPRARAFHVVELSNGQMLRDVQIVLAGRRPVSFYHRMGGVLPSAEELLEHLRRQQEAAGATPALAPCAPGRDAVVATAGADPQPSDRTKAADATVAEVSTHGTT
jgi:pyruvate/2-oxoacid:ferredoxin oxidoreductase alpha subunit